jgi:hypothetical protein
VVAAETSVEDDDFDPESFKVPEDAIRANNAAWADKARDTDKPQQRARRRGRFIVAPIPWIHHVTDVLTTPTQVRAVHHMLFLVRLDKCPDAPAPVRVTAGEMRKIGVSAEARDRTLRQLEAAGLVAVSWQDRAGPIVTLRFDQAPALPWKAGLDAALDLVTRRTDTRWWRPTDLLRALGGQPTEHVSEWPTSVRQLLAMLRQTRPGSVVFRRGLRWVHLAPIR